GLVVGAVEVRQSLAPQERQKTGNKLSQQSRHSPRHRHEKPKSQYDPRRKPQSMEPTCRGDDGECSNARDDKEKNQPQQRILTAFTGFVRSTKGNQRRDFSQGQQRNERKKNRRAETDNCPCANPDGRN